MALAPLAFFGSEFSGVAQYEMGYVTAGLPIVQSPAPPSPNEVNVAQMGADDEMWVPPFASSAGPFVGGCHMQVTQTTSTPTQYPIQMLESKEKPHFALSLDDDTLSLHDAALAVKDTAVGVIAADTWHRIEFYWVRADSPDGEVVVLVDGVEVLSATGDFYNAGLGSGNAMLGFSGPSSGAGNPFTPYIDNGYVLGGATDINDCLGNFEVLHYQHLLDSATPDAGDDLDSGTWENCFDENEATEGYFNTQGKSGVVTFDTGAKAGPYGDSRLTGNIIAVSYCVRWSANLFITGNGMGVRYGVTPNGQPNTDNCTLQDLGTNEATETWYSGCIASGDQFPSVSDYLQLGMQVDTPGPFKSVNGRLLMGGACILHQIPATGSSLGLERCNARGTRRGITRGIF